MKAYTLQVRQSIPKFKAPYSGERRFARSVSTHWRRICFQPRSWSESPVEITVMSLCQARFTLARANGNRAA